MSTDSDRSLGPVLAIAALVLLVAGWAYFAATERRAEPAQPDRPEKPALRAITSPPDRPGAAAPAPAAVADEDPEPGGDPAEPREVALSAARPRPSAALLSRMITNPAVQPTDQRPIVQGGMDAAVERFARCWKDQPPAAQAAEGKAFLSFTVGEGGIPQGPHLQFKSVRNQDLADCMDEVVGTIRLPEAQQGTRVFWPMVLGGEAGVVTLDR